MGKAAGNDPDGAVATSGNDKSLNAGRGVAAQAS
jgi:hypothetical protein